MELTPLLVGGKKRDPTKRIKGQQTHARRRNHNLSPTWVESLVVGRGRRVVEN